MFEKEKDKIDELKEDLIYAVDEHYDGELDIEDVTDTEYLEMKLKQDKKIFDTSNETLAETVSLSIKMMEYYLERLSTISNRTSHRNRALIEETFDDISKMSKILILSIRKNNAAWQALLYENKVDDNKKGTTTINDLLNGLNMEWGEE
nr:MAG TPA: hypothetical protein [Caudoviricetes sp.]